MTDYQRLDRYDLPVSEDGESLSRCAYGKYVDLRSVIRALADQDVQYELLSREYNRERLERSRLERCVRELEGQLAEVHGD